jgi:hypothetical protein
MFRLRSKSGDESVFRSPEEIRAALLSGFVTPDAQIWDAELKGWVPLLEHALYQQIAATPGGRKSGAVKGPPAAPKSPAKLVIKRPGDPGTTAMPAVKLPAPPAAPPNPPSPPVAARPADELPDLELIDLDLTPELEPELVPFPAAKPPAPKPPVVAAPTPPPAPPKRPTPPPPAPVPTPVAAPRASTPRLSTPRMPARVEEVEEEAATGGSKKWILIGAVVILAAGGGGFAVMRSRAGTPPPVDSALITAPLATVVDSTPPDSGAVTDSTARDSAAAPAVDTTTAVVAAPAVPVARPDSTPTPVAAAPGIEPVPFAPVVARGPTPWNARPMGGLPLTLPALEVVRLRYAAAQGRALEQFEAGLESEGFSDLFDPSRIANSNRREESLESIDAGRSALREYRRRQAAIDFAYTDSLRQAVPPGSDTPDLHTLGPILRENTAQAALTDSLVGAVAEIYGMFVSEAGRYALRSGLLTWKEADNADRYRALQERLTAQIARIRSRPVGDLPPAMAAVLRGIGLPR